jgi:hypothetical protein
MTTSATMAKADEMARTLALATAEAGGWCCDVQRIPIADNATTMPVNAVIARRMAFCAVIVKGSGGVTDLGRRVRAGLDRGSSPKGTTRSIADSH